MNPGTGEQFGSVLRAAQESTEDVVGATCPCQPQVRRESWRCSVLELVVQAEVSTPPRVQLKHIDRLICPVDRRIQRERAVVAGGEDALNGPSLRGLISTVAVAADAAGCRCS